MDYVRSMIEALDELIMLDQDDYDYWYNIIYDDNNNIIVENCNEENNKRIWQRVAYNIPETYLAWCYND